MCQYLDPIGVCTLLAALENIIYSVGSFKSRQIVLQ